MKLPTALTWLPMRTARKVLALTFLLTGCALQFAPHAVDAPTDPAVAVRRSQVALWLAEPPFGSALVPGRQVTVVGSSLSPTSAVVVSSSVSVDPAKGTQRGLVLELPIEAATRVALASLKEEVAVTLRS
jgi:hypothetical protein